MIDQSKIYYDFRTNGCFTVHAETGDHVIISCPGKFLHDAKTNVLRYKISHEYFGGCKEIDENSPLIVLHPRLRAPMLEFGTDISKHSLSNNKNFVFISK